MGLGTGDSRRAGQTWGGENFLFSGPGLGLGVTCTTPVPLLLGRVASAEARTNMTQNHDLRAMVGWAGNSLHGPPVPLSPSPGLGTCWESYL